MTKNPASGQTTSVHDAIANTLAAYTKAMDDQDPEAAAQLLATADLHFKDTPPLHGRADIGAFYASAFPNPSRTRHIISNLMTTPGQDATHYSAIYQRWSVADPMTPVCEAFGHYTGRFTHTEAGLIWVEHRVLTT
ncbi:nuclear transport factor 2 family protein [Pseudarthrobacter phenanthrenivorans]|uniref:nuclear transport factor 2 family protein n=1 Tax=Pseudarthrobacter phenanthrenivorans TaxID=361575 RepID=UPI002F357612